MVVATPGMGQIAVITVAEARKPGLLHAVKRFRHSIPKARAVGERHSHPLLLWMHRPRSWDDVPLRRRYCELSTPADLTSTDNLSETSYDVLPTLCEISHLVAPHRNGTSLYMPTSGIRRFQSASQEITIAGILARSIECSLCSRISQDCQGSDPSTSSDCLFARAECRSFHHTAQYSLLRQEDLIIIKL